MKQSQLFTRTIKETPKDETSYNAQALIRGGFVNKLGAGIYSWLPLGLRVHNKIINIIREEMNNIGGQEILMPALVPKENWQTTGRWDNFEALFKLKGPSTPSTSSGRGGSGQSEYALGATHEEVVTPLAADYIFSYAQLPIALYQIQTKFRNEPRAKAGLLRGREFSMKDLYSFHRDAADLDEYYEKIKTIYQRIFSRCGLGDQTYLTFASGGAFSQYSHEFQTICEAGEDTIFICDHCRVAVNKEIINKEPACPECGKTDLREAKAIEVGNIFKLQTKFSQPFNFTYTDETGAKQPVIMGCYGIGPQRVLGAIVELCHDGKGIIWPTEVAPFQVHLLALGNVKTAADKLYQDLIKKGIEVLYDDRELSAGEKFADADLIGCPVRLVVSEKTLTNDEVEVKKRDSKDVEMVKTDVIARNLRSK